jgi:hypothetical protein
MDISRLPLSSKPIPALSEPTSCKHFSKEAGATLTCCTNETIAHITAAFAKAQKAMNIAEHEIATNPFTHDIVKLMKDTVAMTCGLVPGLCPPGVNVTLDKYMTILAQAAKQVQIDQIKCGSGLLAYTEGMICFACEVNWKKFLNNETKVIQLAEETCSAINHACDPVFKSSMNVAIQAQNFAKELVKEISGMTIPFNMASIPDMCGGTLGAPGDCSKHLCHSMLNGFGVPNMSWNPQVGPTPPAARRLVGDAFESVERALGERLVQLQASIVAPALAPARSLTGATGFAATVEHNAYSSSGGYDPYQAGCADIKCPPAGSNPSGMPGWLIGVLACSGVALLVGAVVVVRRRQAGQQGHNYNSLA